MAWRIMAASATGSAHRDHGQPCQDAFASACIDGVLVSVVCDGAGSALHGDIGAQQISAGVVARVSRHPALGIDPLALPVKEMRVIVETAIDQARAELALHARHQQSSLSHYACTIVGAIAGAAGGWFFHIGDGVAACAFATGVPDAVSLPANGEYANETWFVTGQDWRQQLRLSRFSGEVRAVVLMSDGVQPFAMSRAGTALYPPFIAPVLDYLDGVETEVGCAALHATLADPRTDQITGDDKTLLIAMRA